MTDTRPMGLSKRFWLAQALVWGLMVFVTTMAWVLLGPMLKMGDDAWVAIFLGMLGDAAALMVATTLVQVRLNRLPLGTPSPVVAREALKSLVIGAVVSTALPVGPALVLQKLVPHLFQAFEVVSKDLPTPLVILQSLIVHIVLVAGWLTAALAVRGWKQHALLTRAQLDVLRYQLNPHFLFNTLNSLRGLISESPPRADTMVQHLADFLRATLVPAPDGLLPLAHEVAHARSYLAIEKVRFEENLQVTITVDPALETLKVPTLLLNPLVENAVKFGHRTSPSPLRIELTARLEGKDVRIDVANTGSLVSVDGSRTPVGLRNVRERLGLLFPGGTVALDAADGWVRATMRLPLRSTP